MNIALTVHTSDATLKRDTIRTTYVPYIYALGHVPVLIPNNLPDLGAYLDALNIEGIVLTGGGDIHPARFRQTDTHSLDVSLERDRTEWALLDLALERDLPVLGICRGFQVLNVYFGGGLIQDIPSTITSPIKHDSEKETHLVMITDPRVEALLDEQEIIVNSHHHQGVTSNLVAPDLAVFAISPADDLVEGLIHRGRPILAVQWHPERPDCPSCDHDLTLFQTLFAQGAFWRDEA